MKKTFRFRLYSIFIISIIFPSIITVLLFSVFSYSTMMRREEKNIEYVLKSISNSIEVQFTELKTIGNLYYMQKDVFAEVEALNNPGLYTYYDDLSKKRLENNYSISIKKMLYTSEQEIREVVFFPVNSESQQAYSVDKNHSGMQVLTVEGYENTEWFQRAIEAGGTPVFYGNHIPEYEEEEDAGEVYSCVRAIQSMDSKKVIGVIKIDADVENLENIVNVLSKDAGDCIIISDAKKVLAASAGGIDFAALNDKSNLRRINSSLYYAQSLEIPGTDWKLTYLFSMHAFVKSYLLIFVLVCLMIAIVIVTSFLIYKRYSQEMVDDMEHITNVLREIQTGNLDVRAEVSSGNELHDIADAVNHMIQNLKEYIDKEYIWVIRQQRAEYQALQAQINPHFLYNTLNGFIALNRMGETKKLEKSIISLTHMFRYICSSNDITTVEKECAFLEEYLKLEKVKYEERLEYMIWVDEECKNKKIPKLLLQPVVENSIIHGMGDTDHPIMITIVGRFLETKGIGKVMVLTVRDNGVGFEQSTIEDGKEHVGIDNVRIRAELYCKNVIYQCVSAPGQGTKTTFVFGSEEGETCLF